LLIAPLLFLLSFYRYLVNSVFLTGENLASHSKTFIEKTRQAVKKGEMLTTFPRKI
jgi:hypothetical protein